MARHSASNRNPAGAPRTVPDVDALAAALAAAGLAGAAGLNAWLPLVLAGAAARAGLVDLEGAAASLAEWPWLAAAGAALVLDLVGDKLPGVDHVLHVAGLVLAPASAALLATGQPDAGAATAAGAALLGLTVHAGRAALRPASTATTAGLGNPVLSTIEDGLSLVLAVLAFALPALAALAVLVLLLRLGRAAARRRSRPPSRGASGPSWSP
jgi:hypothetical protein